jgi:hypothetical protein
MVKLTLLSRVGDRKKRSFKYGEDALKEYYWALLQDRAAFEKKYV